MFLDASQEQVYSTVDDQYNENNEEKEVSGSNNYILYPNQLDSPEGQEAFSNMFEYSI